MLVAALVEKHPQHALAFPRLQKIHDKTVDGFVAAHSIAELYSVLTTLPIRPRIAASTAAQMIRRDILESLHTVPLSKEDYAAVIEYLSNTNIVGGATYDALVLRAASISNVDQIIILNVDDFRRVYPEWANKIISP